ncbi:MAG: YceI family protein, partial [Solirubrobacteraceae bacterium]
GTIEFGILLKSFIFDRALLQEHFHENYLESNQFPKAVFKGNIVDFKKYKLTAEGSKNVKVNGKLTIHGITKDISTLVEYKLNNSGKVSTNTLFTIIPEDYGIKIPSLVRDKISKTVSISINAEYQKLETKK